MTAVLLERQSRRAVRSFRRYRRTGKAATTLVRMLAKRLDGIIVNWILHDRELELGLSYRLMSTDGRGLTLPLRLLQMPVASACPADKTVGMTTGGEGHDDGRRMCWQ